jgi:hypothetical protein
MRIDGDEISDHSSTTLCGWHVGINTTGSRNGNGKFTVSILPVIEPTLSTELKIKFGGLVMEKLADAIRSSLDGIGEITCEQPREQYSVLSFAMAGTKDTVDAQIKTMLQSNASIKLYIPGYDEACANAEADARQAMQQRLAEAEQANERVNRAISELIAATKAAGGLTYLQKMNISNGTFTKPSLGSQPPMTAK